MADADANDTILTRDAALLQDTVREAGALAQSMFRTELKKWIKGASSPVSEADIAVNDLLETRLRSATPRCCETRCEKRVRWHSRCSAPS